MNVSPSRYLFLSVLAVLLMGGGFYLTRDRAREDARGTIPATGVSGDSTVGARAGTSTSNEADVPSNSKLSDGTQHQGRPTLFGLSGVVQLADVPDGRFKDELRQLNETARRVALDKLGKLRVPLNDVASLSVESNGQLFYQCAGPLRPPVPVAMLGQSNEAEAGLPGAPEKFEAAVAVPITEPPVRHSRPGATKVIYLDFNGHDITGTAWNKERGNSGDANYRPPITTYRAKPFDTDGIPGTFSDSEQTVIVQVWERVAEDYSCFDVDVTTEEPAVFTVNTGRILITQKTDEDGQAMPSASNAAGVAYLDVFGDSNYVSYYSPALIYADNNYNYSSYIAEAASHEMGHNLSLSHDGTTTGDDYYDGHGSGENSWNTIMAAAYGKNVTQWSKGEYFNANKLEDDLAIIAGHVGYMPDDHTDASATATPLTVVGLNVSGTGIISETGEADRFSFESGPGAISFTVSPFRSSAQTRGGNLDVALELYDAGGVLVASANVDGATIATLNPTVNGGTYYLRVFGAGSGTPMSSPPTGYTNYGSLGQYAISGTIISTTPVAPSITSQPVNQSVYTGQSAQFSVVAGGYPAPAFQWQRLPAGSSVWADLSNAGAYSGTTTTTLSIGVATIAMNGDQVRCIASSPSGTATSAVAALTVNPAVVPDISGLPATIVRNYGETLVLAPVITGTSPITYQWKKDGNALQGATASSFSKSACTPLDSGNYQLTASNYAGEVTSLSVTVTINPAAPPVITVQPDSISRLAGSSVTLSVTASGSGPMTYQWYLNGIGISGATNATLVIPNLQAINTGGYSVLVTNPGGSTLSNIAVVGLVSLPGIVSASAGMAHSVFIRADGTLRAMGYNDAGQLGDGTTTNSYNQMQVASAVVGASAGFNQTLFVKSDGTLWAMGQNQYGQLGDGTTIDRTRPVQVSVDVVAAFAGRYHSLFIKSNGSLWAMGANWGGELGDGTRMNRPSPVQVATGVIAAAVGANHSLFIKADGSLWGMGSNSFGELGLGYVNDQINPVQIANDVVAVSANNAQSLFLKSDGSMWATGHNYFGQLGDGTNIYRFIPVQVATGVRAISAGGSHSLFLKSDGSLWAMGYNYYGQLGDGTNTNRYSPVQIVASGVVGVSAGVTHSLFIKSDASLWAMGGDYLGQFGDGTTTNRNSPVQIANGSFLAPATPTGLTASMSTSRVLLTWNPELAASGYELWRNISNNSATAQRIASNVPIPLFYDSTALAGVANFYWIKAVNPAGTSGFSSVAVLTVSVAPTGATISITVE